MDTGMIGVVFGFNLKFEELNKNKIPDNFVYSIISNFESENRLMYRLEYLKYPSLSLLMGPKDKKNKEDFRNIEDIIMETTPLTIPSNYLDWTPGMLAKLIPLPENLPQEHVFGWAKNYSQKFEKFQLNIIYLNLPEYFLKHGGLPAEKLIPKSLGCPLH